MHLASESGYALRRNAMVLEAAIEADHVLFHPESGQFCRLDAVGKAIWNILATPHTAAELAEVLCRCYAVDPVTCKSDAHPFLQTLRTAGFLCSVAASPVDG
jgi:hypothetical protein